MTCGFEGGVEVCTLLAIFNQGALQFACPFQNFDAFKKKSQNGDQAYEDKNYPAAFAEYKKAADAGSPHGQFMLANIYLERTSVERGLGQYMHWLGIE